MGPVQIADEWQRVEGSPWPLGATWLESQRAFNFALYSRHAVSVTLLLYSEQDPFKPVHFYTFNPVFNKTGLIWHCRVPEEELRGAALYAYRIEGNDDPSKGHRYDLVAYNCKHNEANGHNNTDGANDNLSWNCGWEGDSGASAEVMVLRKQQVKNFFCLLMLANGTPMFCAGDEFMNTQKGNNNPYNQDNEITWLDWDLLVRNRDMLRFFKCMIAFRKAHPSIGRSRYWREDVQWYGTTDGADFSAESRALAYFLRGSSLRDNDLYVMVNAYWEDLVFTISEGRADEWRRVVDTSIASPDDIAEPGKGHPVSSLQYQVKARSIVVLER
jgi:pullulanase/glycogen debranching enzyme